MVYNRLFSIADFHHMSIIFSLLILTRAVFIFHVIPFDRVRFRVIAIISGHQTLDLNVAPYQSIVDFTES